MSSKQKPIGYEKDAYVSQLTASRERLAKTQMQILDWVKRLGEIAASEFLNLEAVTTLFPRAVGIDTYRLVFDIHETPKRYGSLGISLRTERMRTDLFKSSGSELSKILKMHAGALDAMALSSAVIRFRRFNEQLASLRFLGVAFEQPVLKGAVLPRWIEAVRLYGERCHGPLSMAFDTFNQQTATLDEAMYDFNSTVGRIRYRAIRCSYTVDDDDLLGPADPALKVVASMPPVSKQFRYYPMADFKRVLKKQRIKQQMHKQLDRVPTKAEVLAALQALRPRKETDWITKDVIKACYLGRKINDIFEAQENLVAVMQPWVSMRTHLQALLP
ncbi:hypothetical protein ACI77O_12075 [Pseudomonas tritici]|uniref:hypothetical protein n=1 Tax=Pseudomonas tritici TaxID=2745518 RepID=UPI00387AD85B